MAGINPLVFGIASIAHPDQAGAWTTGWALAAVA
jgi:hypothetical protein